MLQPQIWPIEDFQFPGFEHTLLDNGIPMYTVTGATEPVFKLDLHFRAGRWYEHKPGAAQALFHLIGESTQARNAEDLAEAIEFFGARISQDAGLDYGSVTLSGLTRHAAELLPVLAEMVFTPGFRTEELEDFRTQAFEDYKLNAGRNDFLSEQAFRKICFGEDHPYGAEPAPEELGELSLDDLEQHHRRTICRKSCRIFLSGAVDQTLKDLVNRIFGSDAFPVATGPEPPSPPAFSYHPRQVRLPGKKQQQSVIIIGRPAITRSHPDFRPLFMLHTILGGYFGSRLMKNVREEKGLTYYIGSALENLHNGGILEVSTEVKAAAVGRCINEIDREMEILRSELIGEKELSMVRSYIIGNLLAQCDGPFLAAEYLKQYVLEPGLDMDIAGDIRLYRSVTAEEINRVAREYLAPGMLSQVIAG